MTECDYNLLDEEWIPVLLTDGGVEKVGILGAFERAYDIEDLACELPTQKIAIQRVLLAICYRVAPLEDEEDWKNLWRAGLPTDAIRAYLEKWRDRFYLFGGRHPFMQAPDLRTPKDAVSGLEKIVADVPNGEQLFTTRHRQALKRITPSEAAAWVIHTQAYDPSGIRSGAVGDVDAKNGKGYPIGPAWCGQTGAVWLRGGNLEETLMLNLVPADTGYLRGPSPQSDEAACTWESEVVETAVRRDYSREGKPAPNGIGIPRLLTWHSRRMRLHGDRDGVTGVVLAQGDKLGPQNMQRFEPMSLWRYSQPQSKKFKEHIYMPAKHEPGRAFWRNLPSTLPVTEKIPGFDKQEQQKFQQSATLLFQAGLDTSELERFPVRIRLEAVGMTYGAQEAVIEDLYHDQMTLAKVLLEEERKELAYSVKQQVLAVEEVAKAVGILGANLSRAAGESGDGAGEGAQKRAKESFFALIDDPFRSWLASLDGNSDVDDKQREWTETARRVAKQVAGELVASSPRSAIMGRDTGMTYMSSGIAENFFNKALNKILPPINSAKGESK
ncbi:type I-E CRISPR-associated protein Cse1/CasA [Arachnia propionica]|uniref:type I-E CRISPR-associated protein Cse1/CasA n=1 Tax=Arachnia propionica TaxID=1750 RepID=UPI003C6F69DE